MSPDPTRAAAIAELVALGMTPEAAADYYDRDHGWTEIRLRPLVARRVRDAAKAAGLTQGEYVARLTEREVVKMSRKAEYEKRFLGRTYIDAAREMDALDWNGLYPVISQRKVVAVFDCAWDTEGPYGKKPVVNDSYIDADAEDVGE
jgi:hypothetical protein